ncbi:MAG: nucleotidyltransferase family protein [Armatimonadetes bacterium]|nr:nucleotidyltransferase family protein [Armatimonadota bacterium]MDW8028725.1 NTP transferase domain-containing protein [Armatimonadota bacterium]
MARAVVSQSLKVVVLAAGMAHWIGEPKAILKVNSLPIILSLVNALQKIPSLTKISVVGPKEVLSVLPDLENLLKVQAFSDLWTNAQIGIKAVEPEQGDYLLLCAADMPFVTVESLQIFLEAAFQTGAEIVYLAVPISSLRRLGLTEVRRTIARLKEGVFTGGNLFLVKAEVLKNINSIAEKAIRSRKSLWQLGKMAGWRLLLKWLLSHLPIAGKVFLLSVSELEKRAEELLGCKCKVIISDLPELAFDIDKPEDYKLAQKVHTKTQRLT